jgi:diguanylate cyclase (GGDEF)-like protein
MWDTPEITMSATRDPRQWPARTRVRVTACVLIAMAALAGGEYLARQHSATDRASAGEALQGTVSQLAQRLSLEMADRVRDVKALSELDGLRAMDAPDDIRATLENARRAMPVFAWFGLTDSSGTVVAATDDILVGKSIASRPVFQNGIKAVWVGDVHEAKLLASLVPHASDEPVKFVDVAAPVRGPDGQPQGVLALHLSWQWADLLRQSVLRPRGAPRPLQLMVVDARGELLLPPEKGVESTGLPASTVEALDGRWSVETWNDGREALTSVARSRASGDFPGFGWRVVARDVQAAASTSVQAARPLAYGIALGAGAAFALLVCWAAGHLVPAPPAGPRRPGDGTNHSTGLRHQRRSDSQPSGTGRARTFAPPRDGSSTIPAVLSAQRDALTGLWDRSMLAELLERLASPGIEDERNGDDPDETATTPSPAAASPEEYCLLSIDLDQFKVVNERYGHAAADQVLAQVGRRLRHVGREEDWVFRLEGDHFLVMLRCPEGEGATLARNIARRVLHELQRPMSYRTLTNLRVTASVGGAVWRPSLGPADDALARADEALQAARRSGPGLFRHHAGIMPTPTDPAASTETTTESASRLRA